MTTTAIETRYTVDHALRLGFRIIRLAPARYQVTLCGRELVPDLALSTYEEALGLIVDSIELAPEA
jgi:hypothetical protein